MFGKLFSNNKQSVLPAVIKRHTNDARVIIIFKIQGKYYPANEVNTELFETYLHTGDQKYLQALTDEVEL